MAEDESSPDMDSAVTSLRERREVLFQAYRVWYQHLISSYSHRLIVFQVTVAITTLCLGELTGILNQKFAVVWIACAIVSMAMHIFALRQRGPFFAQLWVCLILLLGIVWSSVLLLGAVEQVALASLHVFSMLVLAVFVGLPIQFAFCFLILLIGIALSLVGLGYPLVYSLSVILGAIGFVVGTTLVSMHTHARFADRLLSHLPETISSLSVLDVLAWQTSTVLGTSRAAICLRSGQSFALRRISLRSTPVDHVFARHVHDVISHKPTPIGVLTRKDLGEQFGPVLQEWFGGKPQRLLFMVEKVIHSDQEEAAASLVPIPMLLAFLPLNRILLPFQTMAAVVRLWLASARSRFFSSDVIFSTQKSVSERELELNELIHSVNNAAQDISIHADRARQQLGTDTSKQNKEIRDELDQIDIALRELSTRVSDVKLMKELSVLKNLGRDETVDIESIFDEFSDIARHLSKRGGVDFSIESTYSKKLGVRVASREFLETCMRQSLRMCIQRLTTDRQISVKALEHDDAFEIEFCCKSSPPSSDELGQIGELREREFMTDLAALHAAHRFLEMSSGTLELREGNGAWPFRFSFMLRKVVLSDSEGAPAEGWVLLVDDNPQVLTFYTRIAEALELPHHTAGSLEEARKVLVDNGKPRLVISDVQLTDGLGLDLVEEIRNDFGKELPIIVVSGESDIAARVRSVGATRHLTKPVGRKRLFTELKTLLNG